MTVSLMKVLREMPLGLSKVAAGKPLLGGVGGKPPSPLFAAPTAGGTTMSALQGLPKVPIGGGAPAPLLATPRPAAAPLRSYVDKAVSALGFGRTSPSGGAPAPLLATPRPAAAPLGSYVDKAVSALGFGRTSPSGEAPAPLLATPKPAPAAAPQSQALDVFRRATQPSSTATAQSSALDAFQRTIQPGNQAERFMQGSWSPSYKAFGSPTLGSPTVDQPGVLQRMLTGARNAPGRLLGVARQAPGVATGLGVAGVGGAAGVGALLGGGGAKPPAAPAAGAEVPPVDTAAAAAKDVAPPAGETGATGETQPPAPATDPAQTPATAPPPDSILDAITSILPTQFAEVVNQWRQQYGNGAVMAGGGMGMMGLYMLLQQLFGGSKSAGAPENSAVRVLQRRALQGRFAAKSSWDEKLKQLTAVRQGEHHAVPTPGVVARKG